MRGVGWWGGYLASIHLLQKKKVGQLRKGYKVFYHEPGLVVGRDSAHASIITSVSEDSITTARGDVLFDSVMSSCVQVLSPYQMDKCLHLSNFTLCTSTVRYQDTDRVKEFVASYDKRAEELA